MPSFVLLQPDALAAALLCVLALHRTMGSIGRSMNVFLQAVPPELLPLLEQRLWKARRLQSVVSIAKERFWALDKASTVGSMHVIIRV